jgi:hypothetical protein
VKVTQNYLVGLTKYPEILREFPWMQTLANKYRVSGGKGCGGCGQQKTMKAVTDQVNDVCKILGTIPETEVQRFKALVKQDQLIINYFDTRGVRTTVTR